MAPALLPAGHRAAFNFFQQKLQHARIVKVLQPVDAPCQRNWSIAGQDGAAGLQQEVALIVVFVHIMNADATFLLAGSQHSLVYMLPVHAFAAIAGQQGRVYINNAVGVGLYQCFRNFKQETRQHQQAGPVGSQRFHKGRLLHFLPGYKQGRDVFLPGNSQHTRVCFVGYNQRHTRQRALAEEINNSLGIAAAAGGKNYEGMQNRTKVKPACVQDLLPYFCKKGLTLEKLRLDKYLWSIRIFKTRSQATAAIDEGKVKLNGQNIKPSRTVALGDKYEIKTEARRWTIQVTGLLEKRVAYEEAIKNYVDLTTEEDRNLNQRLSSSFFTGKRMSKTGKPTKKQRRDLDELLGPGEG